MLVLKRKASASQGWSGEGEFAMQKSLSSCDVLNFSPTFPSDPSESASCSMSGGGNCQSDAQTHADPPGPFCPVGQPSNSPPLYNVSYSFPPPDGDSSLNPTAKRLRYLTGCVAANTSNEECGEACQLEGLKENVFLSYNHSVSKTAQTSAFSSLSHSLQHSSYSLDGSAQTSSLSVNRNKQTSFFSESQLQMARSDTNHPSAAASSTYPESSDAASGRPNGNSSEVIFDSSYDVDLSSSLPGGTNTALTGVGQRALGSAMPVESVKAEGECEDKREHRRRLWTSENISIGAILFGKTLSRRRTHQAF